MLGGLHLARLKSQIYCCINIEVLTRRNVHNKGTHTHLPTALPYILSLPSLQFLQPLQQKNRRLISSMTSSMLSMVGQEGGPPSLFSNIVSVLGLRWRRVACVICACTCIVYVYCTNNSECVVDDSAVSQGNVQLVCLNILYKMICYASVY